MWKAFDKEEIQCQNVCLNKCYVVLRWKKKGQLLGIIQEKQAQSISVREHQIIAQNADLYA